MTRTTIQQRALARLLLENGFKIVEQEWPMPGTRRRFDLFLPEASCVVELVGVSGMRRFGRHKYAQACEGRRAKKQWCMKNGMKYVEVHLFDWTLPFFYPLLIEAVAVIKSKRLTESARVFNEYSAEAHKNLVTSEFISYDDVKFLPWEDQYKKEIKAASNEQAMIAVTKEDIDWAIRERAENG